MNTTLFVGLALVSGFAITLQAQFMGLMDRGLGTRESVFITYGGGGLLAILLMAAGRGGHLGAWRSMPWYAFTPGALGLVIVGTIGYVVPRLGVARSLTLIIASQLLLAALIDHFGIFGADLRPMDGPRALGMVAVLAGAWLAVR